MLDDRIVLMNVASHHHFRKVQYMIRLISFLFIAVIISQPSFASELRCNGSIIKDGLTMSEVESLCGKPAATHVEERAYREIGDNKDEKDFFETVDLWLIDQSGSDLRVVEFFDSKVKRVATLDRRGESESARAALCVSSKFETVRSGILIKYFCGAPESTSIVSDEFVSKGVVSGPVKTQTQKRIRTERWSYRIGGKDLRFTVQGEAM